MKGFLVDSHTRCDVVLFVKEGKVLDIRSVIYRCLGKYWNLVGITKEWTAKNLLGGEDSLQAMRRKADAIVTRRVAAAGRGSGAEATPKIYQRYLLCPKSEVEARRRWMKHPSLSWTTMWCWHQKQWRRPRRIQIWKGWKEETVVEARLTFPRVDNVVFEVTWKSLAL